MDKDIDQLNLNDSELLKITIKNNDVVLALDYVEDYATQKSSKKLLSFKGCTDMNISMNTIYENFGHILFATQSRINDAFKFVIETNTSCCKISIIASSFLLSDLISDDCCPCPEDL